MPRFEHVLVDQTGVGPDEVEGGLKGRIAQLLMMAAYGRHAGAAMEGAARLLASLSSGGGVNYLRLFLVYVMATQDEASAQAFDAALRSHGPANTEERSCPMPSSSWRKAHDKEK